MNLYIRSAHDMPHASSPLATVAMCGIWLGGAKPITEQQALVWLNNARCPGCFTTWRSDSTGVATSHPKAAAA